jgi:hypothetical protein
MYDREISLLARFSKMTARPNFNYCKDSPKTAKSNARLRSYFWWGNRQGGSLVVLGEKPEVLAPNAQ